MGTPDTVTKTLMSENKYFADVFNYFLYGGKQVINPEKLSVKDVTEIALPYGTNGKITAVQKHRDVLKSAIIMEDSNAAYLLLGIENQTDINNAMPVKNMLYDSLQYSYQVRLFGKKHRDEEEKNNSTESTKQKNVDFLSELHKEDKLVPVITLTLYFGADDWTAPKSLHEMLDVPDKSILKYVPDYPINLITPKNIPDGDFDKFQTEMKQLLKYIKYSNDRNKLDEIVHQDPAYESISREVATAIETLTNTKLNIKKGKKVFNVTNAIDEMKAFAKAEGKAEGRAEGRAEGKAEGRAEGIFEALIGLVKDGLLPLAVAAQRLNMTVSEFEAKSGLKA